MRLKRAKFKNIKDRLVFSLVCFAKIFESLICLITLTIFCPKISHKILFSENLDNWIEGI